MLRSRSFSQFLILSFITLILQACGDDSDRSKKPVTDFENYRELHLSSLEVTVGGEVVELVPSFSKDFIGPYSIEVAADIESITLKPTLFDDFNLIEIAKNEIVYEDGEPKTDEYGNFIITSFGEKAIVASGAVDTKTIREGDNYLEIRISPPDSNVYLVYKIFVHRPSTAAQLLDVRVLDRGYEGDGSPILALTPEFDPTVSSYTASAPYHACTVDTYVRTPERHTSVTVNGVTLENLTTKAFDIDIGETTFNYVSTPELGDGEQSYTITVTRAAATEEDLAADATLASLELTGGEFSREFRCLVNSYSAAINNVTESVQFAATPIVDGAVLRIGNPLFNLNGEVVGITFPVEYTPGEAFNLDLEVGNTTQKAIEVTSTSGDVVKYYLLSFLRLSTNRITVETAEELQEAMRNAQPNDEIFLTAASYNGVASEETSGHPKAHFYAAASGTLEQPIILRSGISGFKPQLIGDATASNAVLRIEGDYWVVQNLELTGSQTGVVIDGGNHNTINGVVVDDVNERGIHIRNGSSNNIVQRSVIVNTGLNPAEGHDDFAEAIVVGSDAEDWSSAPEGSLDEKDYDNIIANNLIGTDVRAEAIDVKEGTLRTQIRHNIIDLKGITSIAEDGSAIVVKGNNVDIAYNSFFNDPGTGLTQLITLKNVQRDWLSIPWGEDARMFQNSASLGAAQIPMLNSTDVINASVADNTRLDGVEVSYVGMGIDESFSTPKIVIKTLSDTCLTDTDLENATFGLLEVAACSNSNDQQWLVLNEENGYVYITKDGLDGRVMRPDGSGYYSGNSNTAVEIDLIPEGDNANGFVFRWQVLYSQKGVSFANKGYNVRSVLDSAGVSSNENLVVIKAASGADTQYFVVEEI